MPVSSFFAIWRNTSGAAVFVSVEALFVRSGSVVPSGTVTVAVFAIATVAHGETLAVTVYVAVPSEPSEMISSMSPEPLEVPLPPANTAVQDTPVNAPENVSTTRAPVTALGPALVTVTV